MEEKKQAMPWRDPATGQAKAGDGLYESLPFYNPKTGQTETIKVPVRNPSAEPAKVVTAFQGPGPTADRGLGLKFDGEKPPVGLIPFKAWSLVAGQSCSDGGSTELYDEALDCLIDYFATDNFGSLCEAGSNILTLLDLELVEGDQDRRSQACYSGRVALAVTRVLEKGAKKYAADSWQHVPNGIKRYADALLRHLFAWESGEELDKEFQEPHLAHAACCVLFLVHLKAPTSTYTSTPPL
jgi:Domain of unknown function (DUF5664)